MTKKPRIGDEEILSLYASGVRDFTAYKVRLGEPEGMNLSRVDFSGQDLSECFMPGINLSGANLRKAAFAQSNLDGADLTEADLTEANLSETSLYETNLTNARLNNAFFDGGTRLLGCNLTETNLTGVNLTEVWMERNVYSNTIMPDGSIKTGTE